MIQIAQLCEDEERLECRCTQWGPQPVKITIPKHGSQSSLWISVHNLESSMKKFLSGIVSNFSILSKTQGLPYSLLLINKPETFGHQRSIIHKFDFIFIYSAPYFRRKSMSLVCPCSEKEKAYQRCMCQKNKKFKHTSHLTL